VIQNITFVYHCISMKIYRIKILILLLASLAGTALSAQEWFPENGILFNSSNVARVDILIDQDSLDMILEPGNEESRHEFPAVFTFKRGATTSTIESIGFRLRGNTSRNSAKKSFKVSLNSIIKGQKFHGVEKINLNGEHNDPSISRAYICWDLYRKAGVPASRAGFTELYINSEYKGLYINVEHIDEEFTQLRFGNNNGNLYKCLWPADLTYLGSDPDLYKFEHGGRRAYELKNSPSITDYTDLSDMIKILHDSDPADFPQYLEPVFNVNTYLKNLVVEVLTGHWDAYSYNKNNFYLYHNESTGKFEFIPYDPDNTLGISWSDTDWANRNIYNWSSSWEERPLTEKILQNDIYRDRFSFYMNRFLNEDFNSSSMSTLVDGVKNQIKSYAENDMYRTYDYDYTYSDFLNSFDQSLGAHVRYGIKPFIATRSSSAADQLFVNEIAPALTIASINKPHITEDLKISALVEDELPVSNVSAWFSENGGDFIEAPMTKSNGDMFSITYPGLNSSGYVSFYIEATDQQANTTREPPFGSYKLNIGLVSAPSVKYISNIDINVYPNPAQTFFTVDAGEIADYYQYRLFSISGKIVQSGEADNRQFTVLLNEHTPDGLYYLEVRYGYKGTITNRSHTKVIIQK